MTGYEVYAIQSDDREHRFEVSPDSLLIAKRHAFYENRYAGSAWFKGFFVREFETDVFTRQTIYMPHNTAHYLTRRVSNAHVVYDNIVGEVTICRTLLSVVWVGKTKNWCVL